MYCPVCRTEFREGFLRCSTCDAALADTLPALPVEDSARKIVHFERLPDLLRRTDVRVIVLSVITGHALASGISVLIGTVVNTAVFLFRSRPFYPSGYDWFSTFRVALMTSGLYLVFWALTVAGAVILLLKLLGPGRDGPE